MQIRLILERLIALPRAGRLASVPLLAVLAVFPMLAQKDPPNPPPPDPPDVVLRMPGFSGSFLGVGVSEVDSNRAKELKLSEERGVEITRVETDSPAEKAGLKVGDVVLEYNGQRVEGIEQFVRLVRETPAGRQAKLLVSRNGLTQTLTASIASRKGKGKGEWSFSMPRIDPPQIWIPDTPRIATNWRSAVLGVEAEGLESQLASYFGVKEGVLVRSVLSGTPAEKAGLKAGDVITKVEKTDVSTPRELSSRLRSLRTQKNISLTVIREKKEITVSVTLDDEVSEKERPRGRIVVRKTLPGEEL